MPKLEDTTQRPFLEVPTESLSLQALKLHIELRADGSSLRKLQTRVGENKETFGQIMDELARRGITDGKLEVPFTHTMESLFTKKGEAGEPE